MRAIGMNFARLIVPFVLGWLLGLLLLSFAWWLLGY